MYLRNAWYVAATDAEISAYMGRSVEAAFNADRDVLVHVQKGMSARPDGNMDIAIDAGPLLFLRRLQKRIDAEVSGA